MRSADGRGLGAFCDAWVCGSIFRAEVHGISKKRRIGWIGTGVKATQLIAAGNWPRARPTPVLHLARNLA